MASINEELSDRFKTHQIYLLRMDADERRKVLELFSAMEKELENELSQINRVLRNGSVADIKNNLTQILKSDYYKRTLSMIQKTIKTRYAQASDLISADLLEIAENETKYTSRALGDAMKLDFSDNILTENYLRNVVNTAMIDGAPTAEWWKRQAEKTRLVFEDGIRQGLVKGEGMDDITRRLFGTAKQPGMMEKRRKNAEALVRSSVQAVTNKTRLETLKRNNDVVKGIQWSSTLDNRTSLFCISMDGLAWDLDYKPLGHHRQFTPPPAHWNCRSTTTPILKSFRDLGIDTEDIPESTRASMDGQVPKAEKFGDWLEKKEKKDPGFANRVLGPGRAELWRKGKITTSELADFRGHVLTIKELKNLD